MTRHVALGMLSTVLAAEAAQHERLRILLAARGVVGQRAVLLVACIAGSLRLVEATQGDTSEFYARRIKVLRQVMAAHQLDALNACTVCVEQLPTEADGKDGGERLHWWAAAARVLMLEPPRQSDTDAAAAPDRVPSDG